MIKVDLKVKTKFENSKFLLRLASKFEQMNGKASLSYAKKYVLYSCLKLIECVHLVIKMFKLCKMIDSFFFYMNHKNETSVIPNKCSI